MHTTTSLVRAAGCAVLAALAGCAAQTPQLDERFGMTQNTLKMQQILAPAAPAGQQLTQIDGPAAKAAFDSYVKSYQEAKPQEGALSIGVGR
jgi:hypothetical protein